MVILMWQRCYGELFELFLLNFNKLYLVVCMVNIAEPFISLLEKRVQKHAAQKFWEIAMKILHMQISYFNKRVAVWMLS